MNYYQKIKNAAANTGKLYSNVSGDPQAPASATLPQINRTYRVFITNSTNIAATYLVGGYNLLGDGNLTGNDSGISITTNVGTGLTGGGTHGALKREMQNHPSTLVMCRYITSSATNYANTISYQVMRGSTAVLNSVEPANSQSPLNNQSTIIDITDFNGMEWNGTTQVTGSMVANSTITFVFNIGSIVDLANSAYGTNVVKTTPLPAPAMSNNLASLGIIPAKLGVSGAVAQS